MHAVESRATTTTTTTTTTTAATTATATTTNTNTTMFCLPRVSVDVSLSCGRRILTAVDLSQ